ncbi:MAG TPA: ABC transporter permease [Candidatus Acidoferrales bacterium]|nr:ABC transporter permease [Candidatus Acidoferrales bacterium]
MDTLLQDVRYALRQLRRSPGFALVAVLTLALGIGANTTIFTVVNAVLLRPLPVEDPEHLVAVLGTDARNSTAQQQFLPMSYLNFQDLRDKNEVLTGMAAFTQAGVNLSGAGNPEQLNAALVSGNYFDVLGVHAALGNTFDREQAKKTGGYPVVVLSYGFWQRRFGADRSIVGKPITLNQQPYTVIGVASKSFQGTFTVGTPDLWIPDAMHDQVLTGIAKEWFLQRRPLMMFAFGRLRSGVSLQQAQANLQTIAAQLAKEYPNENEGRNVRLLPLAITTLGANGRDAIVMAGALLMTVVGLVLLIACANLANLLLARGADRRKELAVRMSLGATRSRLVTLLLTESVLLALAGGGAGLAISIGFRSVLMAFRPPFLNPGDIDMTMDPRVLLFTIVLALGTAFAFGMLPAWQAIRFSLNDTLKEGGGRSGSGGGRHTVRNGLVVVEVALSMIALIGSGLFLSSLHNAQQIDPGFETKNLLVMSFDLGAQNYTEAQGREFYRRLMERLRAIPQVRDASVASNGPLAGGLARTVFPEGVDPTDRRNGVLTAVNQVDTEYFKTTGTSILHGRGFAETDREGAPLVAVVNQAFADKFFPGQDALGKRFRCWGETWILEIVGVARTAKQNSLGEDPTPAFFLPMLQQYSPGVTLHVRTAGDPMAAMPTVRSAVQELDRQLPLVQVQTISQVLDAVLWPARFGAMLLLVFGLLALTLAAIGIYGVMSYSVQQRQQELGIRLALGAQKRDVLRLVLGQGLWLAGAGALVGLVAAFLLGRAVSALLFGVQAVDPVTFTGVPLVLIGVALLACYIPARRATRVDPIIALRYE